MSLALKDKRGKVGFHHAFAGIRAVFKSEWNFRFHVSTMVLVLAAGLLFELSQLEWALIIIVIGLVLLTELLNTAIEKLIDYLRPEIHPDARFIKDAAAGAVFVSSIVAVLVGVIIFLPKLLSIF
ncbi:MULTISPECIES: diacylglycerol kinase family protein [unclassified Oceanobacillus]|uniref:diacylglycerol kinase family protein n=1 Tax=unclassified Oceanobacillus TaxID=2630292 RepID=UPI0012EC837A|nr:diacylglycerol kinase family protein [Oceanobacillus sp. AG]